MRIKRYEVTGLEPLVAQATFTDDRSVLLIQSGFRFLSVVEDTPYLESPQYDGHPSKVVGMGMRHDDRIQPIDPVSFEIWDDDPFTVIPTRSPITGVDEHVSSPGKTDQRAVTVTYIEKDDTELWSKMIA